MSSLETDLWNGYFFATIRDWRHRSRQKWIKREIVLTRRSVDRYGRFVPRMGPMPFSERVLSGRCVISPINNASTTATFRRRIFVLGPVFSPPPHQRSVAAANSLVSPRPTPEESTPGTGASPFRDVVRPSPRRELDVAMRSGCVQPRFIRVFGRYALFISVTVHAHARTKHLSATSHTRLVGPSAEMPETARANIREFACFSRSTPFAWIKLIVRARARTRTYLRVIKFFFRFFCVVHTQSPRSFGRPDDFGPRSATERAPNVSTYSNQGWRRSSRTILWSNAVFENVFFKRISLK